MVQLPTKEKEMSQENNKPVATLKDGLIKAVIWKNEGEKGVYHTTQYFRLYRDKQDQWQEINSFSRTENLQVARLALRAYDAISDLRDGQAED